MSEAIANRKDLTPESSANSGLSLIMNEDVNTMASQLKAISNFQSMVEQNLNDGQDYGVIPGTGGKPTLLKPGAEKIQMLMGVTSEYDVIKSVEDYEKGFFTYTVKCTLLKNGQKITEGLGSANTKEKRYKNQDAFMLVNTVLKMAKKRAQVDATLTIASLSNVFTQDIEDMQDWQKQEATETMNNSDASSMKVNFGKYKGQGKTLGELVKSDRGYVEWLSKNARDDAMKQATKMVLNSKTDQQPGGKNTDKASKPNEPAESSQSRIATQAQINLIAMYSSKIAQLEGVDKQKPATDALQDAIKGWKGTSDEWANLPAETAVAVGDKLNNDLQALNSAMNHGKGDTKDPFADSKNADVSTDKLPFD
ncbi:exodeoxyribonuclease X [Secundilactobacillus pentosiphilus]|uniref:Exodeoxyribonuclease X n=1 Tax=Secundilactobacillus pentosiphilus TaxID=1714682 RepID=A0A1Z5IYH5_9LACO|nr:hypothetical protein [Secundilactobacillus pentosiphilus]GAX06833.1 exodeoxyribonuclease X [Secundilactobacillus pentosiphilus]